MPRMTPHPRRIAVITVSRADWSPLRSAVAALSASRAADVRLIAAAAHLDPGQGRTADQIERDGFPIAQRIPLPTGEGPGGMAQSIGAGVGAFASALLAERADLAVVLGDRYETLAAATAACASGIPLAHIHGGEITEGAIDNQFRYAVTALANLHLVATPRCAERLRLMGEDPGSIVVTGAPGLDRFVQGEPLPAAALATALAPTPAQASLPPEPGYLLVTLHPCTLDSEDPSQQARELVAALDASGRPVIITAANADPGGEAINAELRAACAARPRWRFAVNLGADLYRTAIAHAAALVGNSSSGIIEAASFHRPVVNIGDRQRGRERSGNVIDCAPRRDAVAAAIASALSQEFAERARAASNIYGDGHAGERIAAALLAMPIGPGSLRKAFRPPHLPASPA